MNIINNAITILAYSMLASLIIVLMMIGMYTIYSGLDLHQLFATVLTLGWVGVVVNAFRD
jgi:hypothetical protein